MGFSRLIDASIEWAAALLFRPFNVKKWLILGFIALMAGALTGGGNFRISLPNTEKQTKNTGITQYQNKSAEQCFRDGLQQFKQSLKNPLIQFLVVSGTLFFVAFMVFMIWVCARFVFVFLESVIKNQASIKIPFRENKAIGNSLFKFWLVLTVIIWAILGILVYASVVSLIKSGIFNKPPAWESIMEFMAIILPYILIFTAMVIISAIIGFFINHFTVLVMFKRRLKILDAIGISMRIVSENKKAVSLYFLLYLVLKIGAWFVSGVLYMVGFLGILFPAVIVGAISYLIYTLLPSALHALFLILLVVVFVPTLFFISYCFICLYLPFGIFLRAFNIKFLAAIEPEYDLFKFQ